MAMVLPGEERDAEDHEPDDRRDRAVDPLDPRLVVVERRDQLPVAQRPVGAAHAGIRRPDDHADRHEEHGHHDRREGELLESGHGPPILRGGGFEPLRIPSRACAALPSCSSPSRWASSSPPAARPRPAPSPSAAPSTSAATASVIPVIVSSRQVPGPNRFVFSFLDPKTNLPAASPDRTASVAFIAPGQTQPGPATEAEFVWAIEGERGDYVANVELGAPGDYKAVFITEAPGSPQEAIGVDFQVSDSSPDGRDRRAGTAHGQPDDRERGLRRQGVHGHRPGRDLLPADGEGGARLEDAVRARVRHPGVLPERAVRPDPRPDQGRRGQGTGRRRVHQRGAVPARLHRGPPPAGPRRERPAPAGRDPSTSGASSPSRGCSRSTGRARSRARSRA